MAKVTVSIGAQWGDEGKGKWVDALAAKTDLVVRYQGGNNAGHTLYVAGERIVLHQLPSGVFQKGKRSALAAGVVVNPSGLLAEIDKVAPHVAMTPDNLWLSGRAHVITPWHIHLDSQRETNAKTPIGTTKRGIGPTYSEKAARSGLRLGTYTNPAGLKTWFQDMVETTPLFAEHREKNKEEWGLFETAASRIAPFVCDAEQRIRELVARGGSVLLEGAQGALLDIDHGTYPYVTSSGTTAGAACQYVGLPPKAIGRVIGIGKAYLTRVGTGPFPTELKDDVGRLIADRGREFGATTGRPRRCGWLDGVALKHVIASNGLDELAINKIDILTGLDVVKMAVAYEHPRLGRIEHIPYDVVTYEQCKPVYETFPGWTKDVPTRGRISDLPKEAERFIQAIAAYTGVPVTMVGTGPGRDDALFP